MTKEQVLEVARLKMQGYSNTAIGRLHNVSPQTISRYLKSPEAVREIEDCREMFRHRASERLLTLPDKAADMIEAAENQKDFDAASRGFLNLEKASVSLSGEAKKIEMTGPEGAPLQLDVRAILAKAVQPE